jgi:hypothetical protein
MRGPVWDRLLREYYYERVFVDITAARIAAWPDLSASGDPAVYGAAWPGPPGRAARAWPGPAGLGYAFGKPFSAAVGSLVVGFQAPMP